MPTITLKLPLRVFEVLSPTYAPQRLSNRKQSEHVVYDYHLASAEIIKQVYDLHQYVPNATWCFWCCHPFDGSPIRTPVSIRRLRGRKVYSVSNIYCSLPCLLADAPKTHPPMLREFLRDIGAPQAPMAPPRATLRVFGGVLSIEQFRSLSARDIRVTEPPFIEVVRPQMSHTQTAPGREVKEQSAFRKLQTEAKEKRTNTKKARLNKLFVID